MPCFTARHYNQDSKSGGRESGPAARPEGMRPLAALPLLLLATTLGGTALRRRPVPPVPIPSSSTTVRPPHVDVRPVAASVPRMDLVSPTYPLTIPPLAWSEGRRRTWDALLRLKTSIDVSEAPLHAVLLDLARQTGVSFQADAEIRFEPISFQVSDILLDGVLKLVLFPKGLRFDIQDDGQVRVCRTAQLPAGRDDEILRLRGELKALENVELMLNRGWDGRSPDTGALRRLYAIQVTTESWNRHSIEPLMQVVQAARLPIQFAEGVEHFLPANDRIRPAITASAAELLDAFCGETGLGWTLDEEEGALVQTPEGAARSRIDQAIREAAHLKLLESFERPWRGLPPLSIPDLAAEIERTLAVPVSVEETLWTSEFLLAPAARIGTTLRDLESAGLLRFALHKGRLFLLSGKSR